MKMKLNRSLKDLKIQHHKFNEEASTHKYHISINSPLHNCDSHINLESVAKELSSCQPHQDYHRKNLLKEAKFHKYTQSQTRLDIPVIKYIPVSPKDFQECRTERAPPKI